MKIQIASDLHLEFLEPYFPDYRIVRRTDADVLVIAGDIHRQDRAIAAFCDWNVPVIYVHGNHELYGGAYESIGCQLRATAAQAGVHYLERDEYRLNGVRFLGCCLWTDYELIPGMREEAQREANDHLMDRKMIVMEDGRPFGADIAQAIHRESLAWLREKLDEPFDGKTVIVTHHAPHPASIHPRFAGSLLNAAFVSDLTPLVQRAHLWIHGHVHDSADYRVGAARVIANPRGYPKNRKTAQTPEQLEWENPLFDPLLVVEI